MGRLMLLAFALIVFAAIGQALLRGTIDRDAGIAGLAIGAVLLAGGLARPGRGGDGDNGLDGSDGGDGGGD